MEEQKTKQLLEALLADNVEIFSSLLSKTTSYSDYHLLNEAIKFSRKSIVYHLLDKGCCVYKLDSPTLPLHSVLAKLSQVGGWTNVVLKLLYAGARVSDEDAKGNTALHVAFANEVHARMMEFLVKVYLEESGEDVVNADGLSVLHVVCSASARDEFVRQLLEMKADVNRQVPNRADLHFAGYTPLHFAVHYGNHEVAELLLKRGARIYEDDFNRATPLHLACYRRDSKMIDLILTHDRVTANVVDKNGLSHFMITCASNEPAFAEEQLRVADCRPWTSSKTLINSCTKNNVDCPFAGYTPLHFAAEFGSVEVLGMLLIRGANCCATTAESLTPLTIAHKRGHKDVARILGEFCVGYRMYEEVVLKVNDRAKKGVKGESVCVNNGKAFSDKGEVCVVDSSRESNSCKVSALKRKITISCLLAARQRMARDSV